MKHLMEVKRLYKYLNNNNDDCFPFHYKSENIWRKY